MDVELPQQFADAIVDPGAFVDANRIEEMFTWIRANNPLGLAKVDGFVPFWVVSKHADVLEVSKRNDIYDSSSRPFILGEEAGFSRMREINNGSAFPFKALTGMDEPEHGIQRKLFTPLFQNQGMKAREPKVRAMARREVDRLEALGGKCDFVHDIALTYPVRVVMDFMGVPATDEQFMINLSNALFNGDDEDINAEGAGKSEAELAEQLRAAFTPMERYFTALTESRRSDPQDDIATLIANAEVNGQPIDDELALGFYLSFATAGHHTTASSLAGAIQLLCEQPRHLEALRNEPSLIPTFIEEVLRWITPAKHFMRCANQDTELRGRTIRKGDWMYLSYASANRDEEAFDAPFEFRPGRRPIKHVAFGFGVHQCLGNMLARLEMRMFLEELVPRIRTVSLSAMPALTKSRWVQGLKTCPIEYEMSARDQPL